MSLLTADISSMTFRKMPTVAEVRIQLDLNESDARLVMWYARQHPAPYRLMVLNDIALASRSGWPFVAIVVGSSWAAFQKPIWGEEYGKR